MPYKDQATNKNKTLQDFLHYDIIWHVAMMKCKKEMLINNLLKS